MKKVSKLLVIFAAAVAMVLMMGCQQPAGGNGGGNKPSSNPSGGNPTPPVLNSEADLYVLGAYESSEGKLEFKDNKEGSFTTSTSPNMRAATISKFTWTTTGSGSGTITITIKYDNKTGTLKRTNGRISGKLDDSASEEISNMPLVSPQESDIRGKTGTLYYPSQSDMDKKLGSILFYPTEISYASTGNNVKLTARHYDEDASGRIVTKDYDGKWELWTTGGSSEAYILLWDPITKRYADGLVKFNGDKSKAYAYNNDTGMLVYNVR